MGVIHDLTFTLLLHLGRGNLAGKVIFKIHFITHVIILFPLLCSVQEIINADPLIFGFSLVYIGNAFGGRRLHVAISLRLEVDRLGGL